MRKNSSLGGSGIPNSVFQNDDRSGDAAQNSGGQEDDSCHQIQNTMDSDSHQAKRQQQQPDDWI